MVVKQLIKLFIFIAGCSVLVNAAPAYSADAAYPNRPVTIIVPFPPGGLTDNLGRLIADQLSGKLKQSFIVENKPGAGTLLAAQQVAKDKPDGYRLMVATTTTLSISPALYKHTKFRSNQLTGVAMLGNVTLILVARPNFPANTAVELVGLAKKNPGKYTFASPGSGTGHHLLMELLKSHEKLNITHIPFQGSPTAMTSVMSGRVDFMFLDAAIATPQIKAGKLKALAVSGSTRLDTLPNVPPITDSFPFMNLQIWQSIAAPANTPKAIVALLNKNINGLLKIPAFRKKLADIGLQANPMSVDALNQFLKKDEAGWADIIKKSGSQVD
ncbi:MAG: tripartite tricarboxylate transporter substrate binding protein [Candidimonas sp.]|nr:MAG: tripartite tricarboxylate transporter substrate binding protein [Candidimonas sp.]TAM20039.1 MAG: tripartite tricarboxylate transporter substrate binding protein [Candidimonas sp.]TAM77104.1 MAG: tripartite tricarboxylate transporter substrate binding protein [Candidimonas sp.]